MADTSDPKADHPSRLGQVAAWVVIVAGVVFVVAVIFFSGLLLGWSSSAHHGWHQGGAGTCPMMNTRGMAKPGDMGPRAHPGPTS